MTDASPGIASDTTVLIVDDDEDLADTYAAWLEQVGADVQTAYGGDEALAQLDPSVDVVLLDRRMPRVPGDAVLETVRERPGDYQVSMLTAVEPEADILELPFDEYLTKPVNREELVDVVERLLTRESLDDELQELFRMTSTVSTLRTGDQEAEQALAELEARIRDKESAVDQRLERLDDPEEAFAVVDQRE